MFEVARQNGERRNCENECENCRRKRKGMGNERKILSSFSEIRYGANDEKKKERKYRVS